MRNVFSRRDFLKASAAAVLAASAAGVLTGCDGGGEQLAENEAVLGDFKIKVTSATTSQLTSGVGENAKNEQWIIPTVKVSYNGKGLNALKYTDVFSAKIDGKELKLTEPTGFMSSVDAPFLNSNTITLKFKTPDEEVFNNFYSKEKPMQMTVKLFGVSVTFFLRRDGNNITIKKS